MVFTTKLMIINLLESRKNFRTFPLGYVIGWLSEISPPTIRPLGMTLWVMPKTTTK